MFYEAKAEDERWAAGDFFFFFSDGLFRVGDKLINLTGAIMFGFQSAMTTTAYSHFDERSTLRLLST